MIQRTSQAQPGSVPCFRHPKERASYQCPDCMAPQCHNCVKTSTAGHGTTKLCAHCGRIVNLVERTSAPEPLPTFFLPALKYPLQMSEPARQVGFGAFIAFYVLMRIFMQFNPLFYLTWLMEAVILGFFFSYVVAAMKDVADGKERLPEWPDFTHIADDIVMPYLKFSIASAVLVLLPILLSILVGAFVIKLSFWDFFSLLNPETLKQSALLPIIGIGLLLTLVGICLIPISFFIIGYYQAFLAAINPLALFGIIRRVPGQYLMLLLVLFLVVTVQSIIQVILSAVGLLRIPFLGQVVAIWLGFYISLVCAYMIGKFVDQNKYRIGFEEEAVVYTQDRFIVPPGGFSRASFAAEPAQVYGGGDWPGGEDAAQPDSSTAARPAVAPGARPPSALFKRGREYKAQGDLTNALACFEEELNKSPKDPATLGELVKLYRQQNRDQESRATINKLMGIYIEEGNSEAALVLFGEVSVLYPQICFKVEHQRQLIDWLESLGDHKNTILALRNLAHFHPQLGDAKELLVRASGIARNKLQNESLADKITQYTKSKYPD